MSSAPDWWNPDSLDADSPSYYRQIGEHVYLPTLHSQGAWQPFEQHMAPVAGLIAHVIEGADPRQDLQLSRVTYEILGLIPAAPSTVTATVIRPGRTIELVEATMSVFGKDVVRARGWRLSQQDTSEVAGGFPAQMQSPECMPPWSGSTVWGGGYIASLDFRAGAENQPGRGQAWVRSATTLVEDTPVSDVVAFLTLVDTANGVTTRAHPGEWMFPNIDLTVHLFRNPQAGWVGLDTEVIFGETGVGLTSSTLYDVNGAVGRAEQILTVREVPGR